MGGRAAEAMRFAVVCRCNMNRSMEAHAALAEDKLQVESYGTGRHCKLPGPDSQHPNIFEFGMSYRDMAAELQDQNASLWLSAGWPQECRVRYTKNGVLEMLERNAKIKPSPQRWQD